MGLEFEFATVKQAARGQWPQILSALGIGDQFLWGKHGPCPGCGGEDRFRYPDRDGNGEWYCSQGGATTGGDGFGLLRHALGWEPGECLRQVAGVLGIDPDREPSPEERERWRLEREAASAKEAARERGTALLQECEAITARLRRRWRSAVSPVPVPPAPLRERARRAWHGAAETGTSAYLERKQVLGLGVRYRPGLVLVAVRDIAGHMVGIQYIGDDGAKHFLRHTPKRGGMGLIGEALLAVPTLTGEEGFERVEMLPAPEVICIGEGYATVATVCALRGWPGVIAFDCGNLPGVAAAVAWRWPGAFVVVLGDFDRKEGQADGDPGVSAAVAAAEASGGVAVWPDIRHGGESWDWNDVLVREGEDMLRDLLEDRLRRAKLAWPEREAQAAERVRTLAAACYGGRS